MTTATKTAGCRRTKMTTDLVCPCGKRLKVSVQKNGWLLSLIAVALAHHWKLEENFEVHWGKTMPAYCPNCHGTHQCQRRDCP